MEQCRGQRVNASTSRFWSLVMVSFLQALRRGDESVNLSSLVGLRQFLFIFFFELVVSISADLSLLL